MKNFMEAFKRLSSYVKEDIGATGTLHKGTKVQVDTDTNEYKIGKSITEHPSGTHIIGEPRDDLYYNAKTNSVERINPNDEPKQDLLVICLEDIDSVPNVYYKGKPIDKKVNVDFSWRKQSSIFFNPTYINIEHKEEGDRLYNTKTIQHNEMSEDHDLQEKYDELKEKYDKLLEGMAVYMLGKTEEYDLEGDE